MTAIEANSFPLGLGTSKLRSLNGGLSARAAERLLQQAFDMGIRFFDTAPLYGQGQAESAIGRLPAHLQREIVVCSKVGRSHGRKALLINALKPVLRPAICSLSWLRRIAQRSRGKVQDLGGTEIEVRPDTIRESLAGTLRRLRRERLDLLLLHNTDIASLSDENCEVLEALQSAGDIGAWGVSTSEAIVARRAVGLANCQALQVPVEPEWVADAFDVFLGCESRGVDIIANRVLSPLQAAGSTAADRAAGQQRVERCFEFALRQPGVRTVLCGTTSSHHLDTNVRSMRQVLEIARVRS